MKKVKVYTRYKEFYKDLFTDIDKAKRAIYLEFAIVEEDRVGNQLRKKLMRKSLRGVDVRFVYDGFTTRLSKKFINELETSGVKTFKFKSIHFKKLSFRANHRKLVLIDEKISYVGGMNIGKRFIKWKDKHIRLDNILKKEIKEIFFQTLTIIQRKLYFNAYRLTKQLRWQPHQKGPYRVIAGVPSVSQQFIRDEYIKMINNAKESIYLSHAYFLPTNETKYALRKAIKRGVDVRVIVPKHGNLRFLHYGSQYLFARLLRAGIKMFQYPSMMHSKTMVCDGKDFTIGSANFNNRSFALSYELNIFATDKRVGGQLREIFLQDLRKCDQVFKEEWMKRSLHHRILEFWYARFRSLY